MNVENVFRTVLAAHYDGTNGLELLETVRHITVSRSTWEIHEETDEVLTLRESQGEAWADWPIQRDRWLVIASDFGIVARLTPAEFASQYRRVSHVAELISRVGGPGGPGGGGGGGGGGQPTPGPVHGP